MPAAVTTGPPTTMTTMTTTTMTKVLLGLAMAGLSAAQSSTVSLFLPNSNVQSVVAAVVGANAVATTYLLSCPAGADSNCGYNPPVTVTEGPSTFQMALSNAGASQTIACVLSGGTGGVCTTRFEGSLYGTTVMTNTLAQGGITYSPVVITAGQAILASAEAANQVQITSAASPTPAGATPAGATASAIPNTASSAPSGIGSSIVPAAATNTAIGSSSVAVQASETPSTGMTGPIPITASTVSSSRASTAVSTASSIGTSSTGGSGTRTTTSAPATASASGAGTKSTGDRSMLSLLARGGLVAAMAIVLGWLSL